MSKPYYPLYIFMLLAVAILLSACHSDTDPEEGATTPRTVIVLFSTGGLGDRGYCDLILGGLQLANKERNDFTMYFKSPQNSDDAEFIFKDWLSRKSTGGKSLFILASSEYEEMARRVMSECNPDMENKTILLFETSGEFPHPKVHTIKLHMYGGSYLAGVTAAYMGMQRPIVMLGSSADASVRPAMDGFVDGYKAITGKTAAVGYFRDDEKGYYMPEEAYSMMPELSADHDFIYPVAGGTNLGIYRYLRENPSGPYVAGMDVVQNQLCNNIVGSMIKHLDQSVRDAILNWCDGVKSSANHLEIGLKLGYTDWILSERFLEYQPYVDKHRAEALEKEENYR